MIANKSGPRAALRLPVALAAGLLLWAEGVTAAPLLPLPPPSFGAVGDGSVDLTPQGDATRPAAGRSPAGGGHRGAAQTRAGRPPARGRAPTNINHNVNRNINRNANVHRDVDVNVHHDYHNDWDDWDDHWHPVATAAVVATTAAVVGSIVRSVPPNCSTIVVDGISYSQCGSTWYQPRYVGSSVQYVVVNPPR